MRERVTATVFRKLLKLPKPPGDYTVERGIRIAMRDGVELVAEHWAPAGAAKGTVLVHSPYGWNALWGAVYGAPYAGHGYHVVLSSARGTFGSGGDFEPMVNEVDDTADVVEWLRGRPWFEGRFAMVGASYLGFTQWATLMKPPPELAAIVVQVGFHDLAQTLREGGAFKLHDFLAWSEFVARQEEYGLVRGLVKLATIAKRVAPAYTQLPLGKGTADVLGGRAPWFTDWLEHPDVDDPFWSRVRLGAALDQTKVPVLLHTGWMDIFLDQTMEQYARLAERSTEVALTVGPWMHNDIESKAAPKLVPEALDWLAQHLDATPQKRRSAPVKVFVTGADEWRDLSEWPPPTQQLTLHPHEDGTLRPSAGDSGTARFTYDPADPTPTVGGRLLTSAGGHQDDSALAGRDDVVTFTGDPLTEPVEIIGSPVVTLAHESDNPHADLFVRISEVDRKGKSHNITDGFVRQPARGKDGLVRIELDPAAHRFAAGSRVRLIIAGGSFPRWDRNLGSGGDPLTSTAMTPSTRTITLPGSGLVLPVRRTH
jgi:putative CocE/NonD family hydrolase